MANNLLSRLTGNSGTDEATKLQEFVDLLIVSDEGRRVHERTPCYRQLTMGDDGGPQ